MSIDENDGDLTPARPRIDLSDFGYDAERRAELERAGYQITQKRDGGWWWSDRADDDGPFEGNDEALPDESAAINQAWQHLTRARAETPAGCPRVVRAEGQEHGEPMTRAHTLKTFKVDARRVVGEVIQGKAATAELVFPADLAPTRLLGVELMGNFGGLEMLSVLAAVVPREIPPPLPKLPPGEAHLLGEHVPRVGNWRIDILVVPVDASADLGEPDYLGPLQVKRVDPCLQGAHHLLTSHVFWRPVWVAKGAG